MSDESTRVPEAPAPLAVPDEVAGVRRFRPLDALILAVATVLGVLGAVGAWNAKVRAVLSPEPVIRSEGGASGSVAARGGPARSGGTVPLPPPEPESPAQAIFRKAAYGTLLALPPLAAWTLALAVLRLVKPRGTLREVARHPGSLAALAAGAVLVAIGVAATAMLLMPVALYGNSLSESYSGFAEEWGTVPLRLTATAAKPAALAVVIGWVLLLLGRKGRRGRSWIEPAGVAVGLLWLAGALGVAYVDQPDDGAGRGSISLQGAER